MAARIALTFLGVVAALALVLAMIDWNAMRGPVSRYFSARLDRDVRIDGDLDVVLFSWTPRATADGTFVVVVSQGQIRQAFAELLGINIARALLMDNRQQTDVRCAVAEFSARDGVLTLR
jgi:hypothetical protein